MDNFKAYLIRFKDIITTVVGFVPLVCVVVDQVNTWLQSGSTNWMELMGGVVAAILGWFIGKGKIPVPAAKG